MDPPTDESRSSVTPDTFMIRDNASLNQESLPSSYDDNNSISVDKAIETEAVENQI